MLLEICAWLRFPDSGKIMWENTRIDTLTHDELANARKRIGFIFQKHALIHNLTLYDNIALPLRHHKMNTEKDIKAKVKQCMDEVGLFNVERKFPNELSNGQLKSAALARAIIMEPAILFADEPTAGVDPFTEACIVKLLQYFKSVKGLAIVMTSNQIQTIRGMESPLHILDNGNLFEVTKVSPASNPYQSAIVTTFQALL
jgi:ABC-type methionine transport system ATPase subunit